jgi:hypothetical protein
MKKILILSSLLLLTATSLLVQCRKKDSETSAPVKPLASNKILPAPQGSCNCGSKPACTGFSCVDKLLDGKDSKTFTISWETCVNPDPSNSYCNGPAINGNTSTIKLCYLPGSCTHITAIISNPPSCLPCIPDPYCISLVVKCHGQNDFDLGGNETFPDNIITVTISSDPKISITCGPQGSGYNCSGTMQ